MAQKFHFAILRIEVTRASRGLSAIAELLVSVVEQINLIPRATLGPPESISQTTSRSVGSFCTANGRESLYFTMGRPFSPQNCPLRTGGSAPHLILGSLGPPESPQPKRHLDQFSRFCRVHDRDRPTDRPRYSICNNGPHLRSTVIRSEAFFAADHLATVLMNKLYM